MSAYDVVVVGGGPAGAVTAANLAQAGVRVLVLEGKPFPRAHIGESLLAMSMGILRDSGALPRIADAGFVDKTGAIFVWGDSGRPLELGMTYPHHAYQVSRARFDQILLEYARDCGAEVRHEWWAREPRFDAQGRIAGIDVTSARHDAGTIGCRYLVDASGLFQFLPRRLALPLELDGRRRVALSRYYRGAGRLDPPHEGNILSEACADGWLWFIPLDGETTSVGFVSDEDCVDGDPQTVLDAQIRGTELTADLLAGSVPTGRVRHLKYTNHLVRAALWRDGYVLAGDTALFVDPLFSTGVHGALYSASLASACLQAVLDGRMADAEAAAWYDDRLRRHYRRVSQTVRVLYGIHRWHSRFWRSRSLDDIDDDEAERVAQDLGVNGMTFFHHAVRAGVLRLPPALATRLPGFFMEARVHELDGDAVPRLAPEVIATRDWVLRGRRMVPGVVLRHARGRTQVVEQPLESPYGRFLRALDGRTSVRALTGLVARDDRERALLPSFAGALVVAGVLEEARPDTVPAARHIEEHV